jgi:hypothetical protein
MKKQHKKEKKMAKKEKKRAKKESMSSEGLSEALEVPFGDGGLVTYPKGYKGAMLKIKKPKSNASHESGGGESDDDNHHHHNTEGTTSSMVTNEKSASELLASGDAMDFFSKLKQVESSKAPVGTVHATGGGVHSHLLSCFFSNSTNKDLFMHMYKCIYIVYISYICV